MMKRNRIFLMIILAISLNSSTCDKFPPDKRYPLYFLNNSDHFVLVDINTDGTPSDPIYPDTSISENLLKIQKPITLGIKPGQKVMLRDASLSWEKIYDSVPSDTLSFMVFDRDTLNKYDYDLIREDYMILQRYDLSIYDLQKLDYTLYFPPTEAMRNMKMYPAYGANVD